MVRCATLMLIHIVWRGTQLHIFAREHALGTETLSVLLLLLVRVPSSHIKRERARSQPGPARPGTMRISVTFCIARRAPDASASARSCLMQTIICDRRAAVPALVLLLVVLLVLADAQQHPNNGSAYRQTTALPQL